jgi:hypothetical protein
MEEPFSWQDQFRNPKRPTAVFSESADSIPSTTICERDGGIDRFGRTGSE